MARILITSEFDKYSGRVYKANEIEAGSIFSNQWRTTNLPGFPGIYLQEEVRVLPSPGHRGIYDYNHPGEQDPDSWDRQTYKDPDKGRHLLHTGEE